MHLYRPTDPVEATIVKNEICMFKKSASVVRDIQIDVSGTKLAGKCQPGQALGVLPDHRAFNNGIDPKTGKPHKLRLYSFSHPTRGHDGKGNVVSVSVKRTVDEHWDTHALFTGVASNWLCDRQVGDKIKVSGPNGKKFLLPKEPNKHDYVFVATGTGIAPFRGMVIDLLEAKVKSRIFLIMGVPYSTDLLYHDQMLGYAKDNPNFSYITAVSREKNGSYDRLYVQDRIRTERDMLLPFLANDRTLIYMCGLAGMELGVFQELALNLNGSSLERYLSVDNEAMRDIRRWNRQMIHKQVRPSHNILMEVYA
jgi:ferredoxin--NADP+ reductase